MRILFAFLLILVLGDVIAQNKVVFLADSMPPSTNTDSIYIAGSFNGWQPGDKNYAFHNGRMVLDLPNGKIDYKVTRGSWDKTETEANGDDRANRLAVISTDTSIKISVAGWKDYFEKKKTMGTASKNVYLLDSAFYMPQLKRSRRVWIYLPRNYHTTTNKRYPVMYMQDGQNLFDDATAYAGEWGVDEFLDSTKLPPCIVVGIDNGSSQRMREYNPYHHKQFGKGEGKLYVDFLAKTLKPFIDGNFRTYTNAANTIVAGSSMGGLISMYAVMRYPRVFGKAGIFSPAFWIAEPRFSKDLAVSVKNMKARVYFYAGGLEGKELVPAAQKAANTVSQQSTNTVKVKIKKTGRHNEAEWMRQFAMFYSWIIKN